MCKIIYETGSLDPQLAQTTRYITESLRRLRESLGHVLPFGTEEQELLEIAQGSLNTAAELKAELDKISCRMAKGKHSAALGGIKRIKKLEKVMRDRQHILETRLLLRIWYELIPWQSTRSLCSSWPVQIRRNECWTIQFYSQLAIPF
jgi:hypothetical protein